MICTYGNMHFKIKIEFSLNWKTTYYSKRYFAFCTFGSCRNHTASTNLKVKINLSKNQEEIDQKLSRNWTLVQAKVGSLRQIRYTLTHSLNVSLICSSDCSSVRLPPNNGILDSFSYQNPYQILAVKSWYRELIRDLC